MFKLAGYWPKTNAYASGDDASLRGVYDGVQKTECASLSVAQCDTLKVAMIDFESKLKQLQKSGWSETEDSLSRRMFLHLEKKPGKFWIVRPMKQPRWLRAM